MAQSRSKLVVTFHLSITLRVFAQIPSPLEPRSILTRYGITSMGRLPESTTRFSKKALVSYGAFIELSHAEETGIGSCVL